MTFQNKFDSIKAIQGGEFVIFESNELRVDIVSFMAFSQEDIIRHNRKRSFDALSFRFRGDTDLITEKSRQHVGDNYMCFVPAGISYDRIAKKDELIAINCHIKGYIADDIECFLPENADKLRNLFKKAFECWTRKEAGYYYRCVAYFYQILAECCKQSSMASPSESKIQASVDFINTNFANPALTLKEIASKSFMSEVYFRKIFKAEYGISPQKYIINLRIQKATELIETGDYSLKEVALLSGYNDYKYFSAEFKRLLGVSPSEY